MERQIQQQASIDGVFTASAAEIPMRSHTSIQAIAGQGLAGDRYALGIGAYSKAKRSVRRDVTLIELEVLQAIQREFGRAILPVQTRRNLLTVGIRLNDCIGQQLQIGGPNGTIIRGIELCEPCYRPEKLSNYDPSMKNFETNFKGRGGLRAEIVKGGIITLDDAIFLLD